MIKKIQYYLNELISIKFRLNDLSLQIDKIQDHLTNDLKSQKVNLGQMQARLNNARTDVTSFSEVEFQVFSQFGDDGIIQYLISKIDITNKTFIEFGVENYREANTRFLLVNNNWSGYVIDGSRENVNQIKSDPIFWAHELYAEASFITAENINDLLKKPPFHPEIGILSIDIDGNDYWVWKAITDVTPIIVIAEYNSLFGKNTCWTIPYDASFVRGKDDSSKLYFGASLKALQTLAEHKGYVLVGCCSRGLNAYFVRKDKIGDLTPKSAEECYVFSKFRELTINDEQVSGEERFKFIEGYDIVDTLTGNNIKIHRSLIEI